jgi:hypothetical protein
MDQYTAGGTPPSNFNPTDISILASNRIFADSFFAVLCSSVWSDQRIKTNVKKADGCLDLINKLETKTYQYIDKIKYGDKNKYGFIAQQVNTVLPQAINKINGFIQNVYKKIKIQNNIIQESLPFQVNTKLKLIDKYDDEIIVNIVDKKFNNYCEVSCSEKLISEYYFCFGSEVDDVLTLQNDVIFSVAVGAVQELSNKIDALETIIQKQQSQIQQMQQILSSKLI